MVGEPHLDQREQDKELLAKFGYEQELHRSLGFFSTFAIAFSFVSATTGIFSLFWYGLDTGGPAASFWGWPIVFFGQLMVALTFAEVSSHYPLAGGLYQWCRHLWGPNYAWFVAWMYLIALLVTVAAVDFGVAPVFSSLFGLEPTRWTLTIIALSFAIVQAILNIVGIRVMAFVNNIGTVTEIIGMVGVAAALILAIIFGSKSHQTLSVVFDTGGIRPGGGYIWAFLPALLASAWVLYGFDSAGGVAEETKNPTREVPRAILAALIGTFIIGGIFILAALVAIPNVPDAIGQGVEVLPWILKTHLPLWLSDVFLAVVCVAIFVCGLAVMATTARLLYSYGRDGQIPASGFFKKVSPRFGTPVRATLFVLAFTAILLIQQSQLYRIIAWATVGIYIPYQMVVFASMRARTRGWPKIRSDFSLGSWGWVVNIIGFVYGVFMIINMSWPRSPEGTPWYDNYLVPLSVIVALGIGLIFYLYHRSKGESMEIRGPEETGSEDTA